jgi:hypothetical protein
VIEKWNTAVDGRRSDQAMRRRLEARSVARYDYPPRTRFPDHIRGGDKIDGVLSGRFG